MTGHLNAMLRSLAKAIRDFNGVAITTAVVAGLGRGSGRRYYHDMAAAAVCGGPMCDWIIQMH